ncbi:MAG: hypothetical protein JJU18_10245 [Oceanicaulis sp.]|nr:hypothetical protein [Oceanicaulis sp.]
MDMAMRSFLLAGVLALIAAAALAGWWFLVREPAPDSLQLEDDPYLRGDGARIEGSLRDEFGEPGRAAREDEIRITVGQGLAGRSDPGSALDGPPRFAGAGGSDDPETPWWRREGAPFISEPARDLPRGTPAERVEADCRDRGGRAWACRCLVRVARARLSDEGFEFLSLAEETGDRDARLTRARLPVRALPELSAALIGVHVEADRRCGAGLTP